MKTPSSLEQVDRILQRERWLLLLLGGAELIVLFVVYNVSQVGAAS